MQVKLGGAETNVFESVGIMSEGLLVGTLWYIAAIVVVGLILVKHM